MEGVTVTLTQEESNFVNYIIDKTVASLEDRIDVTEYELEKSGSASGTFGESVRVLDESILNLLRASVALYTELRDKFPVDNPE